MILMNKANYHAKYRALIFKNIINWSNTSHQPKGVAFGLRNASCIFVSEMKTFSWKGGCIQCMEYLWAAMSIHEPFCQVCISQKHIKTVIYSFYTVQLYAVVLHTTQLRQIQRERNNHPCFFKAELINVFRFVLHQGGLVVLLAMKLASPMTVSPWPTANGRNHETKTNTAA